MNNRSKGIVLSYINTALSMVCGLFLSSFLLRCLGDVEYGIYQTIASFANSLVMLQFGTGSVMTRNIAMCRARDADPQEIRNNVTTILSLTAVLTLVIVGASFLFYSHIDKIYAKTMDFQQLNYAKEIFVFVCVNLMCSFWLQTLNGIILAYEHYTFGSLQSIFHTLFKTVGQFILISRYKKAILIAQVDMAISLILLTISLVYIIRCFGIIPWGGKWDKTILSAAVPLCLAVFLQTITNQANNNVDKFLIGIKLSTELVSLYSVAMYIYSVFSTITTIPISMYAPMVLSAVEKRISLTELEKKLVEPCRLTAITGGVIYFGFLAAGKPFISLLYGPEYIVAWTIAIMIMTPMYINMVNGVLVNLLDALNKRHIRSFLLLFTTTCNILLTFVWLDKWGVMGAALATMVCTFVGQVIGMNLYYSRKMRIRIGYLFREAFRGVLVWLLIACGASVLIGSRIHVVWASFFARVAVFLGVFLMGYVCFGMTDNERALLSALKNRRM